MQTPLLSRPRIKSAFVSSLLLLAMSVAQATVIVPAEFREAVDGSDLIVYGRVSEVRPEWAEGRRQIESYVTFDVASALKGHAGPTIVFKVPGGQIGRYRTFMIGAPAFQAGDEAVLFFKNGTSATPILFGFNQGVFRVRADAVTGRRMVVSPALMATSDAPAVLERGSSARRSVPIETFAAQVQAAMAARREPSR